MSVARLLVANEKLSRQLKALSLASGRKVNPVKNQRQLRTSDLEGLLLLLRILVGQLIGSPLKLLVPDAESSLAPVKNLDPVPSPVDEHEQASR